MNDVISGHQATRLAAARSILRGILVRLHEVELLYAADWEIAYDLQKAKSCIEKEIRMTNEKDLARVDRFTSSDHGDLPRPATSLSEQIAELQTQNAIASDFIREVLEAVGERGRDRSDAQYPAGAFVGLKDLALAVVGQIEQYKVETERLERELREIWWLGHGCPGHALYGDDGEMQCNALGCRHDFKRESMDELRRYVQFRKWKRVSDALKGINQEPCDAL